MQEKKKKIKMIRGLFGVKYPENYQYRISSEAERLEVEWLIREGVYPSIEAYEEHTTRIKLNQVVFE